jgi:hypothetical protein
MWKAAAVANMDFAVTGLHGTVEERGTIFLRHGRDFTPNSLHCSLSLHPAAAIVL